MHAPLSVEHIPLVEGEGHSMRRMAMWGVVLNIVVFMSTPFMLPASMASAGWGLGATFLIYTCVMTYQSGLILGKICIEYPRLDSYPNIARAVFRKLAGKNALEGKKRRWERNGMWFVTVLQCVTYYFTAITEMLTLEQLFGQLFSQSTICQSEWLFVVFALNILPLQIPSFTETVWMAALAGLMLILKLFVLFYEMFLVQPWDCQPGPDYSGQTVASTFRAFAAFMFAYGSHGMFPEIIREMKDVSKWRSAVNWIYAIVVPMYLVSGFLGYFSYGAFAHANININFPGNALNIVSLAVQLFLQIYLLFIPNLVVVMQVELALGVKPHIWWGSEKDRVWGLPPVVFRAVFRTLFLLSQIFLSEVLLTGEGDVILNVQAVAGALGMAAFALFLPLFFDIVLFDRKLTAPKTIFALINVAIGVIVSVAGSFFSIQTVFHEATGEIGGECTLKYAYAPSSPHDPCHISGI